MRLVPVPAFRARLRLTAALAVSLSAAAFAPALAENRVALVVGNASYHGPGLPNLPNTLKDADGVAGALKVAGFQVVEVRDASKAEFRSALTHFSSLVKPGDVALFYYAGHGVQAPGKTQSEHDNYLIPVDAQITAKDAVAGQTVSLTEMFDALAASQAGVRLLILDACRTELPGADWKAEGAGLAWPAAANSRGVFIAFAAAPGQGAKEAKDEPHGYFTGALLKQLKVSQGWSVSEIFSEVSNAVEAASANQQSPWFTGTGKAATLRLIPGERTDDAGEHELKLYKDAVNCGQAACFEAAAERVTTPRLKQDLAERAARLTPLSPPKEVAAAHAPPVKPGFPLLQPLPGMPPSVNRLILQWRGSAAGEREIGLGFFTGAAGFPRNFGEAMRWLGAAEANGDAEAAMEIGVAYQSGIGAPKEPARALAAYLRAAKLGSLKAEAYAGGMYGIGAPGVPADGAKAKALLTDAVERGSDDAMFSLGVLYLTGHGIPKDEVVARGLFERAAAKGNNNAISELGQCYYAARCGVAVDYPRALELSRKAAQAGSSAAAFVLAVAYIDGKGVPMDPKQGLVWLERSAGLGFPKALSTLGRWYLLPSMPGGRDYDKAYKWLRRGADVEEPAAMMGLAICLGRGWGTKLDLNESLKWLRKAATAGDPDAIEELPVFLKDHQGVVERPA